MICWINSDAGASINTPNIGNSALIIEELDWGDTIFHLICNDVRLRISGLQKVVDSPANRSMCERWSFPLNILSPGGLAT